jgi:hypothetical protein
VPTCHAARQLHLLLASHPALKVYKGDPGPPAVVRQEEIAVGKALRAAFRQVCCVEERCGRREEKGGGFVCVVVCNKGMGLAAGGRHTGCYNCTSA